MAIYQLTSCMVMSAVPPASNFSAPLGVGRIVTRGEIVYYVYHVYQFDEKGTALSYFIISDLSMLMLSTSSSLGGNRHMQL